MRKMKLAMLIVFCVMLFGGTVVSFVLPGTGVFGCGES